MKQVSPYIVLPLLAGLIAGCNTTSPKRAAPVVERPFVRAPVTRPAPPKVAEPAPKPDERGFYTVRKGDTLLRIALDHGQNYRDLVAWNQLNNPDDIKVGQVLRVGSAEGERSASVQTRPVPVPPPSTPAPARKTDPVPRKNPNDSVADTRKEPAPAVTVPAPVLSGEDARLSWTWPADGRIIGAFDEGRNKGIDIAGRAGQSVMAAGAGKVMYAGSGIRGYGNLVIVKHSNSLLSAYAHNRRIVVKEGDNVAKGQVIAEMGDSDADTVKLHFEIRQQGKPVDPTRFLPGR